MATLVPAELKGIPGGFTKLGSTTKDAEQSSGSPSTIIESFVNSIVPCPVGVIRQLKQRL